MATHDVTTRDDRPAVEGAPVRHGERTAPDGPAAVDRGVGTAALWFLTLGVVVAIALALWAWADDDTAGPETGVTLNEIVDEPGSYYGQTVTVSGEIGEMTPLQDEFGDVAGGPEGSEGAAFTLGGDSLGEQLLVVNADGATSRLSEDGVVQVTGTVRRFNADGFNQAFGATGANGWFDGGFYDGWDGRPAIVAQSVDPTVPRQDAEGSS